MTEQNRNKIRYLDGCYRGTTAEQNALDAKILRALFRKGDRLRGEGALAGWCNCTLTDAVFKEAIDRLEKHGFIQISAALYGPARRIHLLAVDEAAELCHREDQANRDPEDSIRRAAWADQERMRAEAAAKEQS